LVDLEDIPATHYTYPCRCGGDFVITHAQLEDGVEVIGCGGCGEWVGVGYEVVEDDGDAEDADSLMEGERGRTRN
jgi:hypothetical protein